MERGRKLVELAIKQKAEINTKAAQQNSEEKEKIVKDSTEENVDSEKNIKKSSENGHHENATLFVLSGENCRVENVCLNVCTNVRPESQDDLILPETLFADINLNSSIVEQNIYDNCLDNMSKVDGIPIHFQQEDTNNPSSVCCAEDNTLVPLSVDNHMISSNYSQTQLLDSDINHNYSVMVPALLNTQPLIHTGTIPATLPELPIGTAETSDASSNIITTSLVQSKIIAVQHKDELHNITNDTVNDYSEISGSEIEYDSDNTSSEDCDENIQSIDAGSSNSNVDPNNHNMSEGRKRRKTADPSKWKRNVNKKLRMNGKPYLGFRKKDNKLLQDSPKAGRQMKATCAKLICIKSNRRFCSQFTENQRQAIFNKFWGLSWDERKAFICAHVSKVNKKKNTTGGDSRRQYTLEYRLNNNENQGSVQVCREMFLNTFGIGYRMVQLWVKNSSFNIPDNASRAVNEREITCEKMKILKNFLDSLPKMPSHYNRQNSSKLYLEPIFQTLIDVHKLYVKKCEENNTIPFSRKKFNEVINSENISLFTVKKDQCNLCTSYQSGNIPELEWKEHVQKKDEAREEKRFDKEKALQQDQITLQVDFQAVKLAPFTHANAFYYKTKLACHNLSVYNLATKHATCYWFSEDQNNQLVASTFVSCVLNYLEKYCITPEKKDIVIYSDGCTAQNRNSVMANALLNFSMLHGIKLFQKYLEVGHTQMEVDSVHACIERKLKNRDIKLPSDYIYITKEARQNPSPYEAIELNYRFFKNYTQPLRYVSIRPGRGKNDPTVNDIRVIFYDPKGLIQVKLSFSGEWISLPNRPKKFEPVLSYPPLFTERCKISKTKWLHLQELKTVIPSDCHSFYDNLPHLTT